MSTGTQEATEGEPEQETDFANEPGGFGCTVEAGVLQTFFDTFDTIVSEMKVTLDTDGVRAAAIDPANVGLIEMTIDESAFEHYSSTGGVIGLDLERIIDLLGLADNPGELVELRLDQETRKLNIQIGGLEANIALIDPTTIRQEQDIPDLDLPVKGVVKGKEINRGITAVDMVSNHVRFRVGDNDGESALFIEGAGDTDSVDLCLDEDDIESLEGESADSLFSLDYLKDMSKVIPSDTNLTLNLGDSMPVIINYSAIEVKDEHHSDVRMMLAPRIQKDG